MKIKELEPIFNIILNKTENLVKKRKEILNERVFHHMFSNELSSHFLRKNIDIWDSLLLVPERPTEMKFKWKVVDKYFKLSDVKRACEEGVGIGRLGNFDFAIQSKPPIFIEFKGPNLFQPKDINQVMLKLLSLNNSSLKVFAATITGSKIGGDKREIERRFYKGLKFSLEVLKIESLKDINLYAYVATIPDNRQAKPIFWDNCAKYENELFKESIS